MGVTISEKVEICTYARGSDGRAFYEREDYGECLRNFLSDNSFAEISSYVIGFSEIYAKRDAKCGAFFLTACSETKNMKVLCATPSWYILCRLFDLGGGYQSVSCARPRPMEFSRLLPEALGVPGVCPKKLAEGDKLAFSDYLRSKTEP